MDITQRIEAIRLGSGVGEEDTAKMIKELLIDVLKEIVENGHELGGMGEYGRGWNDAKMQTKMTVREMIERWKNES